MVDLISIALKHGQEAQTFRTSPVSGALAFAASTVAFVHDRVLNAVMRAGHTGNWRLEADDVSFMQRVLCLHDRQNSDVDTRSPRGKGSAKGAYDFTDSEAG